MSISERKLSASVLIIEDSSFFIDGLIDRLQEVGFQSRQPSGYFQETCEGSNNPVHVLDRNGFSVFIVGCLTPIKWAADIFENLTAVFMDENLFDPLFEMIDGDKMLIDTVHERVSDALPELLAIETIQNFYLISTEPASYPLMLGIMERSHDKRPLELLSTGDPEDSSALVKDTSRVLEKIMLIADQYGGANDERLMPPHSRHERLHR